MNKLWRLDHDVTTFQEKTPARCVRTVNTALFRSIVRRSQERFHIRLSRIALQTVRVVFLYSLHLPSVKQEISLPSREE